MGEDLENDADLHYEETMAPKNPPSFLTNLHARRVWLVSSLGIVVAIMLAITSINQLTL